MPGMGVEPTAKTPTKAHISKPSAAKSAALAKTTETDARSDVELMVILRAWSSLPPAARQSVLAIVSAFKS